MAILIPSLGYARFDSRGELRLAERLKDFLEENAVVWHNLPVGPRSRHPDFIIVHPANGLLVLEVKDWRLESIVSADKTKVELLTSRGIVRESNPLEQARKYAFDVVRTLERAGYRCTGEQSAAKGIDLVRQSPEEFDLVVTDLNMPGMSGLDVARELRATNPDLPIIITTGYIRSDDVQAARKIEVRDVLLKPDTIEELATMVQTHLARASVGE